MTSTTGRFSGEGSNGLAMLHSCPYCWSTDDGKVGEDDQLLLLHLLNGTST